MHGNQHSAQRDLDLRKQAKAAARERCQVRSKMDPPCPADDGAVYDGRGAVLGAEREGSFIPVRAAG
jgi:hypothetical protein